MEHELVAKETDELPYRYLIAKAVDGERLASMPPFPLTLTSPQRSEGTDRAQCCCLKPVLGRIRRSSCIWRYGAQCLMRAVASYHAYEFDALCRPDKVLRRIRHCWTVD